MKCFIALLALLAGSAHADSLELAFDAALALDMSTTLDIKNHPRAYERNPILGRHPSDGKIVGYGIAAGLIHYEITHLLTAGAPRLVKPWQYVTIGIEAGEVINNYRIGLRFAF